MNRICDRRLKRTATVRGAMLYRFCLLIAIFTTARCRARVPSEARVSAERIELTDSLEKLGDERRKEMKASGFHWNGLCINLFCVKGLSVLKRCCVLPMGEYWTWTWPVASKPSSTLRRSSVMSVELARQSIARISGLRSDLRFGNLLRRCTTL